MEYFSKLTLDRNKKILILNEEALQSLDADAGKSKVLLLCPLKEEGAEEKSIYILNVDGSTIGSDKEDDKYLQEVFPLDKVRSIVVSDNDEATIGTISITKEVIDSFDKVFNKKDTEFKLVYQENIIGDMKSIKEIYDVNGIYHKITKVSYKKNTIGKSSDVENVEEVVELKKETV